MATGATGPIAVITGAPAFAGPAVAFTADGSASHDPDGGVAGFSWTTAGPCAITSGTGSAAVGVAIAQDAQVSFPGTACVLTLQVVDDDGQTASRSVETRVLPGEHEDTMQKAYIAYYGRPGDAVGLHYWGVQLAASGGDLTGLIAAYGTSAEYTSRFSGLSDEALINNLYLNMFNRDAEPAGLQWYIDNRLDPYRDAWADAHGGSYEGATEYALSRIALDILYGARGGDLTMIGNKLQVAKYFTEQVVRRGVTYDGPDIPGAVALLQQVGIDAATVTAAKTQVDALMESL